MYITILVKHVYWYISQVSGERLQDHWSSGFIFPVKLICVKYDSDSLFNVNLVSLKTSIVDHGRLLFMCDHLKDNVNLVTVLSRLQKKNLQCQGGHLRQSHSQIIAYSLFFKMLLFTIHYITLLFIKHLHLFIILKDLIIH